MSLLVDKIDKLNVGGRHLCTVLMRRLCKDFVVFSNFQERNFFKNLVSEMANLHFYSTIIEQYLYGLQNLFSQIPIPPFTYKNGSRTHATLYLLSQSH